MRRSPDVSLCDFVDRYLAVHGAGREASTITTLRERMRRPLDAFGSLPLRELECRVPEIGAWASELPPGYRHAVVGALRQVPDAAVRWDLIDRNPAKLVGANPEPRRDEVSLLTLDEIDRLAVELGRLGAARRLCERDRPSALGRAGLGVARRFTG